MPPGLCQHPENNLCVADLLQGGPNQWESLQGRLDEHRRWLLQKEVRKRDRTHTDPFKPGPKERGPEHKQSGALAHSEVRRILLKSK